MKTSLTVYIEGDEVEEMHKRHLNLSKTTETALRKELFSEQEMELNANNKNKESLLDGLQTTI